MTQNEAPYNPNESDDEEETVSPPGIKRASLPVNVKRALPQAMTIEQKDMGTEPMDVEEMRI